jgi:cell division protein FtsQ
LCAALALFAFSATLVASERKLVPASLRALLPPSDVLARSLGLGIDEVSLTGHHFAFDGDVFDALDLPNVRTFAGLDARAAKARIERLPWVATAEITRVYPNRLAVRVSERMPFAVWTRGNRRYLIDATGRVLSAADERALPALPRVAGEGAAAEAKALFDLLDRYPAVRSRLSEAERVGERRWNLKLERQITLKLPSDGEARILDELARDSELQRLASEANSTLDFRARGRVAVRREAELPSAPAAPGAGS